jgi:DNA polymerase-1
MVQGAAPEFFKTWAVIVRARLARPGGAIVLCLHDELLVHTPLDVAEAARESLDHGLQEAAHRWEPAGGVRFVTETSVITRWSDAK